jgi:hypothetical protein
MKTAIYIEDGVVQLVLTPESDFEKNAISSFDGKQTETRIFSGSFYDCRGGWARQSDYYTEYRNTNEKSLIMRIATDKGQG